MVLDNKNPRPARHDVPRHNVHNRKTERVEGGAPKPVMVEVRIYSLSHDLSTRRQKSTHETIECQQCCEMKRLLWLTALLIGLKIGRIDHSAQSKRVQAHSLTT